MEYISKLSWVGMTFFALSMLLFFVGLGANFMRKQQFTGASVEGADRFKALAEIMSNAGYYFKALDIRKLKDAEDTIQESAINKGYWSFGRLCGVGLMLGGLYLNNTWMLGAGFGILFFTLDMDSAAGLRGLDALINKDKPDLEKIIKMSYCSVYMLMGMRVRLEKEGSEFNSKDFIDESYKLINIYEGILKYLDSLPIKSMALSSTNSLDEANMFMAQHEQVVAEIKALQGLVMLNLLKEQPLSEVTALKDEEFIAKLMTCFNRVKG